MCIRTPYAWESTELTCNVCLCYRKGDRVRRGVERKRTKHQENNPLKQWWHVTGVLRRRCTVAERYSLSVHQTHPPRECAWWGHYGDKGGAPQETGNRDLPFDPAIPGHRPRTLYILTERQVPSHVHCCSTHNSQDVEAAQMSNVVPGHNGSLLSSEEK